MCDVIKAISFHEKPLQIRMQVKGEPEAAPEEENDEPEPGAEENGDHQEPGHGQGGGVEEDQAANAVEERREDPVPQADEPMEEPFEVDDPPRDIKPNVTVDPKEGRIEESRTVSPMNDDVQVCILSF